MTYGVITYHEADEQTKVEKAVSCEMRDQSLMSSSI